MSRVASLHVPAQRMIVDLPDDQETFYIGRDSESDVVIQDPRCSRRQCVIRVSETGHTLQPLSRKVKTMINGRPIALPAALADGDRIQVGHTELIFRS